MSWRLASPPCSCQVGLAVRVTPPVTVVSALKSNVRGPVGTLALLLKFRPLALIIGKLLILTLASEPFDVMLTYPPSDVSAVRPFTVESAGLLVMFRFP